MKITHHGLDRIPQRSNNINTGNVKWPSWREIEQGPKLERKEVIDLGVRFDGRCKYVLSRNDYKVFVLPKNKKTIITTIVIKENKQCLADDIKRKRKFLKAKNNKKRRSQ